MPITRLIAAAGLAAACAASAGQVSIFAAGDVEGAAVSSGLWRLPKVAACFAPGTDEVYMHRFMLWVLERSQQPSREGDAGDRYFLSDRWAPGTQGDRIALDYSFPSDSYSAEGGSNVLNQRMTQWFGSQLNGQAKFRQVFDRWQELAGVDYTQINDDNAFWGESGSSGRGDIRIISVPVDGGGGVLAFNYFPQNGDMVLDSAENYGSPGNDFRFFRNVVAHENGHGMGHFHTCPQNGSKLMEPGLNTNFDGPQDSDIRAMQRHYGDNVEPNNTIMTASSLGSVSTSITFPNRSIDNGLAPLASFADVDYYRFVLPTAGSVTVSISLPGSSYPMGAQGDNTCPTQFTIDSRRILDLGVELLRIGADDEVIVVASSDSGGLGVAETISGAQLEEGGTLYVRVFTTSAVADVQRYTLGISVELAGCVADANGDNQVDFTDLNLVLFNYGNSGPTLLGDVNHDGTVDFADLNLVLSNYNMDC